LNFKGAGGIGEQWSELEGHCHLVACHLLRVFADRSRRVDQTASYDQFFFMEKIKITNQSFLKVINFVL
jgi:hypothetical protein